MASNSTTSAVDAATLEEDLSLQTAILHSLLDTPPTAETQGVIEKQKVTIADIQKRLGEVRRAQSKAPNHQLASSHPSAMSTPGPSRAGTPSNQRKRSFGSSHLDANLGRRPELKSRKSTPTPRHDDAFLGSDPFGAAEAEIIDLTGDDDDAMLSMLRSQKEIADRARHNKSVAENDKRFASTLLEGSAPSQNASSFGQDSQYTRNDAFGLLMNRGSSQGSIKPEPRSLSSPFRAAVNPESHLFNVGFGQPPAFGARNIKAEGQANMGNRTIKPENTTFSMSSGAVKSETKPSFNGYRMPGSFIGDDDDDDESSASVYPYSAAGQQPKNHSQLGMSQVSLPQRPAPLNYAQLPQPPTLQRYTAGSSIEQARQTALAFQNASHSGMAYPQYGASLPTMASLSTPLPGFGRPGFLQNGIYATAGPSGYSSLSSVIGRTNGFDFDNFTDYQGNHLNPNLVDFLNDYVEDPRKTQEDIQNLLSNIRPDMDIPVEERGETPEALRYPLYVHQQLALKWMTDMEKGTNRGGILADDMGLGKTISTLSLMVTRQADDTIKTNLIIGPVALIKQWESEIKKKLKSTHRMSVLLVHMKRKVTYQEMKSYDVVLTTFGSIASEWRRYQQHTEQRKQSATYNPADDLALQSICPILHPKSKFYRVILDEAQCIKNRDTQQSKGVHMIEAKYRWCLTGTPMMNGVGELFPLMRFLRIRPYGNQKQFTEAFRSLTAKTRATEHQKNEAMTKLRAVLKATMLRRMKNSEIDGKPILSLPNKRQVDDHVVFSDDELKFYRDLEGRAQVQFNKYLRQGTVGKNYSNILVLLLRLRQACCHPHLMDFECVAANEVSEDKMLELAKSLSSAVIERIKGIEAFECPICYEPVPDPTLIIPCGHDTCSECFASLTDQAAQGNIRSGNENVAAKCPVCRGEVQPLKIINYTAFQKAHMPDRLVESASSAPILGDNSETESGTDSGSETEDGDSDTDSLGSLRDFIDDDDVDDDPEVKAESATKAKAKKEKQEKKLAKKAEKEAKAKAAKAAAKEAEKKLWERVKPEDLPKLRQEANKNKMARRRYMHYLRDNWEDSAKVTRVMELLKKIQETEEKTIIFSQWTSLLDLIECQIKYNLGLRYCRYTGGMSRNDRDQAVSEFGSNPNVTIMLVSLRAGNAGLNLTVASQVIICDPFWNPYIEMQAVDRAHRIGQQREVKIHRILVEETVEDRILKIQEEKRQLVETALDEGAAKNLGRLNVNELRYLFGVQG